MVELDGLPGEVLVRRGLEDLSQGRLSAEALTVSLASGRLRHCGLDLPPEPVLPPHRELALYALLRERDEDDAYARYNALRRELDSFLAALDARGRRGGKTGSGAAAPAGLASS